MNIEEQVTKYIEKYKKHIETTLINDKVSNEELIAKINTYPCFELDASFTKKPRTKNEVEPQHRCEALRANNTQCTRRKKAGCLFCGTHVKGIPNGRITNANQEVKSKTIKVFTQDIGGILYYIDDDNNIYNTEDVVKKNKNPRVVGKYIKNSDNSYSRE
tara:strand:- start:3226 stop:3705 length:480 start_codon:yes stop_codon:yes gene_type:complete